MQRNAKCVKIHTCIIILRSNAMLSKKDILKNAKEAALFLKEKVASIPETAIVLGSGLGDFADNFEKTAVFSYSAIPHFPVSTAPDHKGNLVFAKINEKPILIMQGRLHYYEGYSMDEIVFPIRVMRLLGVKNIILTNAVGAINEDYKTGSLMLIRDHIKFFNDTPLRGENIDEFGPRFNDLSDLYTKNLRDLVKNAAQELNISLFEGVYSYMPGPCFETPAEIKMLKTLGADVVGMSTVPEAICASHAGINVLGLSFITNMAAGIYEKIEDLKYTQDSLDDFKKLCCNIIDRI